MSPLLDVAMQVAAPVATALLAYLARVARRLDKRLDDVETHERALFGDESANWPGLMNLPEAEAEAERRPVTDGGETE